MISSLAYRGNPGDGIDGLRVVKDDIPEPSGRQVVIKVMSVAINHRDRLIICDGRYPLPLKQNLIPLCDGRRGRRNRPRVGHPNRRQRSVLGFYELALWLVFLFGSGSTRRLSRWHAKRIHLLEDQATVTIPAHLSFEEAACYPSAGVTAWHALTWGAHVSPGQSVLIIGSGGVSLFALQFAKRFGARVIAITSSEEKAEYLRSLGADNVINGTNVRAWEHEVRRLTAGLGIDRIVEVGGPATLGRSIACIRADGHLSLVGALGGGNPDPGVLYGSVFNLKRLALGSRSHFLAMNRAIEQHELRPIINRVFPFIESTAALKYAFTHDHVGKVVIRIQS